MIEYPLIFLGGFLGSSHCVGMCGALAVSVGLGAQRLPGNLARQSLYTLGRVCTYSFLGAAAGFAGWRLARETALSSGVQAGLAVAAGLLLIWQGLRSAGLLPRRSIPRSTAAFCPGRGVLATFLTAPGWYSPFLAGLLTGFLPCGLVYAYLAMAATSGTVFRGATAMAIFGIGTAPLMILTGAGASLLSLATRRRVLHAAAWCVVLTGALTIQRGIIAAQGVAAGEGAARCPGCAAAAAIPSGQADAAIPDVATDSAASVP